jgi:four helix bundle protein
MLKPLIALEIATEASVQTLKSVRWVPIRYLSLRDQVERAAASLALNTAEGAGRSGKDRAYHFRIALGSARETRTGLEIMHAIGLIDEEAIQRCFPLPDRSCRLLYGLTR